MSTTDTHMTWREYFGTTIGTLKLESDQRLEVAIVNWAVAMREMCECGRVRSLRDMIFKTLTRQSAGEVRYSQENLAPGQWQRVNELMRGPR